MASSGAKLSPDVIDLSQSDGEGDGEAGCVLACTCESDTKQGVRCKEDPTTDASGEGGGLPGLPNVSIHDEVHHLIRAVQQPGGEPTRTRTSATTPSSSFSKVYGLLGSLEEALMRFVATPAGASAAATRLRLRLERQLADAVEVKKLAVVTRRAFLAVQRMLELTFATAVHTGHLELLRVAGEEESALMTDALYLEALLTATDGHSSLVDGRCEIQQRLPVVEGCEKKAAAHEKFLAAQLQVLAMAEPLAQAQQVFSGGGDQQAEDELSRCVESGVGQLCGLLLAVSIEPVSGDAAAALETLARELVVFWTLNRSVLPDQARVVVARSFAKTALVETLAAPLWQALERVCGALDAVTPVDGAG